MWSEGDLILRREVRNDGWSWVEMQVRVVRDEPDLLATYIPEGPRSSSRRVPRRIRGRGARRGPATAC